jgi:hypothetical protein
MRAGEFPTSSEPIAAGVAVQTTPVWPMVVGLAIAAWVLDFLVSWLPRGSMGRVGLVVLTSMLLFTAVMVCGFVVRMVYARLLPRGRIPAAPVVRAACLTALWIPAWVLFVETSSLLMIAAGVICLLSLGYFLKRCEVEAGPATVQPTRRESWMPFMFEGTPLVRALLPSLLLVLLFDAAIALAANYRFILSSVMAGVFAGVLAWQAAARRRLTPTALAATPRAVVSGGRQGAIVAAAFVFTAIAMLPFLRVSPFSGFSMAFGKKGETKKSAAVKDTAPSSDGYVGIILLPMTEQQRKIAAPVKRTLVPNFGVKIAEPMEIPFDGQYWYFKAPEKQPRPTAKVVRGSSMKTQVSSSDHRPLLMEAHQKLAEPLDLGCCSAMDLVVENADRMEGAIALELWVKKLPGQNAPKQRVNVVAPEQVPHYLGTVVIPSSELPLAQRPNVSGKPVEEKLRFPIPAAMDGTTFDEITVVVRQAPERARMGAKVAIRKFVLEP